MREPVLRNPTQEETTEQIDDERASGEFRGRVFLNQPLKAITGQSSQGSEYNQQKYAHSFSVICAPLGPTKNSWAPGGGQESSVQERTVQANSIAFRMYSSSYHAAHAETLELQQLFTIQNKS
jgi:hypothetical protein